MLGRLEVWKFPLFLFGSLLLASGGLGCNKAGPNQSSDPEAAHILKVADLVKEYEGAHKEVPPANLDELKSWAMKEKGAQASDFESTRDQQAYVIMVSGGGKPKKGSQIMVYEAQGKNGKRFTSTAGSGVAAEKPEAMFGYMEGGAAVKGVKQQQTEKRINPKKDE